MSETTIDLLIGEARARQRKRRSVLAVVFAIVVAVALTAGLDRGRFGLGGGSGGSSGSASAVWRPTEDPSPYLVRNPSGAEQDFYALRPVPVGARLLRYVDAAGWSIVYPRRFHAVACSQFGGPIVGGSFDLQGASFANYRPVPALARRPPARGVLFRLTITITSGILGRTVKSLRAHSPLSLADSIRSRGSEGSAQSGSLAFQADGRIYQASFWAGKNAGSSDLRALAGLISSVRFAPLEPGQRFGPFVYLRGEPLPPPGP